MAASGSMITNDVEKGLRLRSRLPVSLRRTEKRTSQSPGSLRPATGKARVLARAGRMGVTGAFLNILEKTWNENDGEEN